MSRSGGCCASCTSIKLYHSCVTQTLLCMLSPLPSRPLSPSSWNIVFHERREPWLCHSLSARQFRPARALRTECAEKLAVWRKRSFRLYTVVPNLLHSSPHQIERCLSLGGFIGELQWSTTLLCTRVVCSRCNGGEMGDQRLKSRMPLRNRRTTPTFTQVCVQLWVERKGIGEEKCVLFCSSKGKPVSPWWEHMQLALAFYFNVKHS